MSSASGSPDDSPWQVICLCAAWCRACGEWAPVFDALAAAHPQARFAWVDIEDEADAMGDVDIETFPTLLVGHGTQARFFGPVQPSQAQVGRLLDTLLSGDRAAPATAPEASALLHRLQAAVLRKS
ncbi:thioredoxin family protein [Ramlibacter sp.]|uniref:thioredoxin family protein n=1 Tax=Ramlibacter sp. TaxID=1917967 RepID=UPI002D3A438F|nr:thioredoxin family protein [Ramlibacter sp.]HYD75249.1 thioredoxin family protein [Ramlibacter sp.]